MENTVYENAEVVAIELDELARQYDGLNFTPLTEEKKIKLAQLRKELVEKSELHNQIIDKQLYHTIPVYGWACFHCGFRFYTVESARAHFGEEPTAKPYCQTKEQEV